MNKIILKLNGNFHRIVFSDDYDYKLYALGMFLELEAVGPGYDFFHRWLNNLGTKLETKGAGGNVSGLDRINDDILLVLGFDMDLYKEDPEKYSLTISIEEFKYVFEEWNRLVCLDVPVITITEDNNKYTIVGSQE